MYLMCSWKSALRDKSVRIYERGTCVWQVWINTNHFALKSTLMILSHHFHVKSTWGFLLWMQEPCRQLRNAWDSERNMCKTEPVTLFHNQIVSQQSRYTCSHIPGIPATLLCVVRKKPQLTTYQRVTKATDMTNGGWVPALPSIRTNSVFQRRYGPQEKAV